MSDEATPKQRYDARMKLKRDAREPDWKSDEVVTSEYAFELADRFVTAFEKLARAIDHNAFK